MLKCFCIEPGGPTRANGGPIRTANELPGEPRIGAPESGIGANKGPNRIGAARFHTFSDTATNQWKSGAIGAIPGETGGGCEYGIAAAQLENRENSIHYLMGLWTDL